MRVGAVGRHPQPFSHASILTGVKQVVEYEDEYNSGDCHSDVQFRDWNCKDQWRGVISDYRQDFLKEKRTCEAAL